MAWIKRNLVFVIVSVVALGLLGYAGYYGYTRWQDNATQVGVLRGKYTELERLYDLKPNPGNQNVNNIATAQQEEQQVRDMMNQAASKFAPIDPIPAGTNVNSEAFASALRQTVEQMQRDAQNASVITPKNYYFSFEAERQLMIFDPAGLSGLARQLGEVKAICDVINQAKVNSLNSIEREHASADDQSSSAPATDYLALTSTSNDLAVLTPYQITFQCFTPELAAVLSGFSSSPQGFIVKGFDVQPLGQTGATTEASSSNPYDERAGMYGGVQPVAQTRTPVGGLQTVIDEKQLRVTMQVDVVRLLFKK